MRSLTLAALLLFTTSCWAQIVPGQLVSSYPSLNSGGERAADLSFTFAGNIPVSDSQTLLLAGCADHGYPGRLFKSVTYGGVAMTQEPNPLILADGLQTETTFFYLVDPPAGPQTFNVTMSGTDKTDHGPDCIAQSFEGVDSATPIKWLYATNFPLGQSTASCLFSIDTPGQVAVAFEYSTGYNFAHTGLVATPFTPQFETPYFTAPQEAWAVIPNLAPWGGSGPNGQYVQSWAVNNSSTSVTLQIYIAVLNPAGSALPPPPPNVPAAPVVSITSKTVAFSWPFVMNAAGYNVRRDGVLIVTGTIANTFTDTTTDGLSHSYYVTAVNSAGESVPSNVVTN